MNEPLFWLGLSILLVATSLTALLVAAIPTLLELARAARSAEKLFDTLSRELPPTLEAIRLTGLELTDLTDDVSGGVKSAAQAAQQVDRTINTARKQTQNLQIGTRSIFVGVKTAWKTLTNPRPRQSIERSPGAKALDALGEENSRNENYSSIYNQDVETWNRESSFHESELHPD